MTFEYIELGPEHLYPLMSADYCGALMQGAAKLPAKFGLSPSAPVFVLHAGFIDQAALQQGVVDEWSRYRPHYVKKWSKRYEGWTPNDEPYAPRIVITEPADGGFRLRKLDAIWHTLVHETGHRLVRSGLVNWKSDLNDGQCSSEVMEFEKAVAGYSTPSLPVVPEPYASLSTKVRGHAPHRRSGLKVLTGDGPVELMLRPDEMLIRR